MWLSSSFVYPVEPKMGLAEMQQVMDYGLQEEDVKAQHGELHALNNRIYVERLCSACCCLSLYFYKHVFLQLIKVMKDRR